MNIEEFITAECKLQNDSTPEAIEGMTRAYKHAVTVFYGAMSEENLTIGFILTLGAMVKPQNAKGFRQTPVVFASGDTGTNYQHIERALHNLLIANRIINTKSQDTLTPLEFYTYFEKIHPFEDGNGRVGAILYNILNGTLDNPILPPDVFKKESE